jgi:beta-N-acetylhexosaminidase
LRAKELLSKMSLEQKIGQMLVVGIPTTTAGSMAQRLIEDYHVGGVILFRRNVQNPAQVGQLTTQLQHLARQGAGIPLIIAIDHEGGTVNRFHQGMTELPANMALGATRSPGFASEVGRIAATELRSMGVNANLAPVLDVNDNPLNPVIGLRSYGEHPDLVTTLGTAYIESLQRGGVIATAKHFPGHGSTSTDSHLGLPVVAKTRDELEKTDLVPFRAAVEKDIGMIMTAHVAFPALDDGKCIPTTLSPGIVHDLLRGDLGYDGVIISDDMGMGAITQDFGPGESAIMAVQAGVDCVLMAGGFEQQSSMYQALLDAVRDGSILEAQIDAPVLRILRLKMEYGLFDPPWVISSESVGSKESTSRMAAICEKAVTLVRNSTHLVPLNASSVGRVLVIHPDVLPLTEDGTILGAAIRERGVSCVELVVDLKSIQSKETVLGQAVQLAQDSDWLLVGTWLADSWQASLVRALLPLGKPLIVMALGTPYDLARFPEVTTYLTVYGKTGMNVKAAAKVIFGELSPTGALPISIPGLYNYGWPHHKQKTE